MVDAAAAEAAVEVHTATPAMACRVLVPTLALCLPTAVAVEAAVEPATRGGTAADPLDVHRDAEAAVAVYARLSVAAVDAAHHRAAAVADATVAVDSVSSATSVTEWRIRHGSVADHSTPIRLSLDTVDS